MYEKELINDERLTTNDKRAYNVILTAKEGGVWEIISKFKMEIICLTKLH